MSFQVTFNTVQLGIPPVVLLSAGEDAFVACGNNISLQGVVDIPANLPGHAILWEQIEGIAVVLANTDTLGTSYAFSERSDKVFRLWVDKGLPEQQFKEVSIYHTPTSISNQRLSSAQSVRNIPTADLVDTISGTLLPFIPPAILGQPDRSPCQPNGDPPSSGVEFDLTVSWTVPNDKTELISKFVESQLYYADTDTPILPLYPNATNPPGSVVNHSFFPGGENNRTRFYVVTRYENTGILIEGQSDVVDYSTIALPSLHLIDDAMDFRLTSGSLANNTNSIIRFTTSREDVDDAMSYGFTRVLNSAVVRFNPTLIDDVPPSTAIMALSGIRINIIRFDSSGIGN